MGSLGDRGSLLPSILILAHLILLTIYWGATPHPLPLTKITNWWFTGWDMGMPWGCQTDTVPTFMWLTVEWITCCIPISRAQRQQHYNSPGSPGQSLQGAESRHRPGRFVWPQIYEPSVTLNGPSQDGQKWAKPNDNTKTAGSSPWYFPLPFPILKHTSHSGLQTSTLPQDPPERQWLLPANDHQSYMEGYEKSGRKGMNNDHFLRYKHSNLSSILCYIWEKESKI